MQDKPVIIHIPHSSDYIPKNIRKDILLNDYELYDELLLMTDRYTDEIFSIRGFDTHINEFSRLVFDPERFRDDSIESMSKMGMGAIYTRTSDGKVLRNINSNEREYMLRKYYDYYYNRLEKTLDPILDLEGRCLIIDGHSFSSIPLPHENYKSLPRPSICIGTDDYHTQPELARFAYEYFHYKTDLTVKLNTPFSGSFTPSKYYDKHSGVSSIMIEINRALYMDEETGIKTVNFINIQNIIRDFCNELYYYYDTLTYTPGYYDFRHPSR